jgi:type IV pilus assembly protein PilB
VSSPRRGVRTPSAITDPDHVLARRLGDILIERGVVERSALSAVLASRGTAPAHRRRIGHLLVDAGLASEDAVARAMAELLDLPFHDLARDPVPTDQVRLLPAALCERHGVVRMGESQSGVLALATWDPQNVVALDDLRLQAGVDRLDLRVATESAIRALLAEAWASTAPARPMPTNIDDDADNDADLVSAHEAPVVSLVGRLLSEAVRDRASDLHIEPQRDGVRIRVRIDGVLRTREPLARSLRGSVVSRLKVIANMDIAERRVPQDGRVRLDLGDRAVDARISTLPSLHGEKVVVRFMAPADSVPAMSDLGLSARDTAVLSTALARPQGLVLITGPTGSGKTSTLFSCMATLNTAELSIVTLEDPVEIELPGVTHVQVNERAGLTFARGLRSVLRQDPDVVLVGEIRDAETALLAARAAMTGHLVLATLHTNDAVAALGRLEDMGVERYAVASSLTTVVAQRLVRVLCDTCAVPDERAPTVDLPTGREATQRLRVSAGCPDCDGQGYRGRRAVMEVIDVSAAMRRILLDGGDHLALTEQARADGAHDLRTAALLAAMDGWTSIDEALRTTSADG